MVGLHYHLHQSDYWYCPYGKVRVVLHDLREAGASLVGDATVTEITAKSVRYTTPGAEEAPPESHEVAADTVILATGLVPNPEPVEALRKAGVPVEVVGDAGGVGYIEGAIHQGFHAAIDL